MLSFRAAYWVILVQGAYKEKSSTQRDWHKRHPYVKRDLQQHINWWVLSSCRALNHSDTRNDFCCSFFWTYIRLFCGSLFVYVNSFLTVSSSLNHFDTRNLRKAYLYKKSPTKETYVCEKRPTIAHGMMMLLYHQSVDNYGVAMISRLLQITGLFCRI